ncbi:hypothetical protein MAPG_10800 [Magnaporthiopsis poae ATCC 64411]|uniref:Uncharacterized protein n=1 Tax=Magnaporthiopsis poae (strain ATCC 64411 / 73-15) TaxID=644358 RepID=A0A0C4EDJ8_MAGP6|nr:hypothetical protein MAPG_10800 [Magnaporthiopsis poae ATCC 64411]
MASLLKSAAVVGMSLGLAAGFRSHRLDSRGLIQPRWTYDMCNNCSLYNVPAPDKNTFNVGPIGNWRADRDYDLCLGGASTCTTKSKVMLDFNGLNLYLNFAKWPTGYEYVGAGVFLAPMGVGFGPSYQPAPTDVTPQHTCTLNPDQTATCIVPFSTLTGVSSNDPSVLFAAMCPLGSRQALDFYIAFSGQVKTPSGAVQPFTQAYPCNSYVSGQCTSYCTTCDYAEMSYRCTKCYVPCPSSSTTTTSSTSTTTTTSSTSSTSTSTTETTTSSTTSTTSSTSTSTTSTTTSTTSSTTTSSTTTTSSSTTTTSSTTTGSLTASGVPVYANPTPIQYPVCSGGSQAYLIIHGAVLVTQTGACGAVVAT